MERFHQSGVIDDTTFQQLKKKIEKEKSRLTSRRPAPSAPPRPAPPATDTATPRPDTVTEPEVDPTVVPVFVPASQAQVPAPPLSGRSVLWQGGNVAPRVPEPEPAPPTPRPIPPPAVPRKRFTEMLAAFMEQSNIRWGEIVGGLLIIGCSTALVVSLWAQISRIPVLSF